jgi:hypothetical protein
MIYLGGHVYVRCFASDEDRRYVDAYGTVVTINDRTITVRITWKAGVILKTPEVRRVLRKDITAEVPEA